MLFAIEIGAVAGLIPVYLGLLPFPLFRKLSLHRRSLLISFSVGILLFLFADVTGEAIGLARGFQIGPPLFALGLTLGLAGPAIVSHRLRQNITLKEPSVSTLRDPTFFTAYMVSLGIGLHNLGEGLALGAAYAAGQLALTGLLVIGFALHNGTEGMGIAGPVSGRSMTFRQPLLMGFVAGFPTIVGSVIGSLAYSELLGTLFFSSAGGALLYVIVELIRVSYTTRSTLYGVAAGLLMMYFTDLLLSL